MYTSMHAHCSWVVDAEADVQEYLVSEEPRCLQWLLKMQGQFNDWFQCMWRGKLQWAYSMSVAWIDYCKAFDSVPRDWLLEVLKIIHVPWLVQLFLSRVLPLWCTKLCEIWQGSKHFFVDSCSSWSLPGWFFESFAVCLSLVSLSQFLRQTVVYHPGPPHYRSVTMKVTHLFYMDDLKIYSSLEALLKVSLDIVSTFSKDIGMTLSVDKCAISNVVHGVKKAIFEEFKRITLLNGSQESLSLISKVRCTVYDHISAPGI